jgi:DNA-binding transcriptional MocR family regulator
MVIKN